MHYNFVFPETFQTVNLDSLYMAYLPKDSIQTVFNNYLPQLKRCDGLIIDIRKNRGGSSIVGDMIADHLIFQFQWTYKGKFYTRKHISSYKNWGQIYPENKYFVSFAQGTAMEEINHGVHIDSLNDSLKLPQPVIVLSGHYTASAAESFLLTTKEAKRVTIVGEPSAGCVDEPMLLKLPGEVVVMFSSKKYVNADGTQPNDGGILPDIQVAEEYDINGRDNIIEKALEILKK
jgi:C-terminal processing protease CtpA/Prc